jgi:hypothetical protein
LTYFVLKGQPSPDLMEGTLAKQSKSHPAVPYQGILLSIELKQFPNIHFKSFSQLYDGLKRGRRMACFQATYIFDGNLCQLRKSLLRDVTITT